jgi:hypothetical protein
MFNGIFNDIYKKVPHKFRSTFYLEEFDESEIGDIFIFLINFDAF